LEILMSASHSVRSLFRPDAGWTLSLYPTAGEASGSFVPSYRPARAWVPAGDSQNPARARAEAARRAKKKLRLYAAHNRLNRLGTLTYAGSGCHDPSVLREDVAAFFRALRDELGGSPLAYVWVPEWHKSDHGLHVHFAVGQFIARGKIASAWGRGFVHIKRLSDLPVGSTTWDEARRAAGYLSKYVTKAFEPEGRGRVLGLHRYEVAQGFQPTVLRLSGRSARELREKAEAVMGGPPARSWSSAEVEDWKAPPAVWFAWN
jgi:hypothetical protein